MRSSRRPRSIRALAPLRRAARRPVPWWCATAVLAVVTGAVVNGLVARADDHRRQWGEVRRVVVMAAAVERGEEIGPDDVVEQELPVAVVPVDALAVAPVGRLAIVALFPGEVVLADRVAADGLRGVAALLPAGSRALAVPAGPGTPPLEQGDIVDVLVTVAPGGDSEEPTFPVVEAADVVAVDDAGATIAVPRADAPRVAFALTAGRVTLALAAPE